MSSAAVSTHSGAGPLGLMSCVRESSPPQDIGTEYEMDKNVASKKKFWNPRKWFKRKPHKTPDEINPPNEIVEQNETVRSRSASELSVNEEPKRRRSSNPISPGLSVSHDSVFPHSGSELDLDTAKSTSSLSIHQPILPDPRLQTELTERLRLRRGRGDTSEDDEGLPRSPCNSPTTTDELLEKTAIKDLPTKSQSTCSDGSLLSMGSSEMDEDSIGHNSKNSSKSCLSDKKPADIDSDFELGPLNSLNHSAAHHKVAVRPKRTHGAPRRKRLQQINTSALPTTPEVNEDSSVRSLTPDASNKESVTELYVKKCMNQSQKLTEIQIKCSSLPPGLAGPGADGNKLSRSRSNAGSKSQDIFATLGEEEEDKKEKSDKSFFGRIFPRKSGRKKKNKEERPNIPLPNNKSDVHTKIVGTRGTISIDSNLSIRPNALVRSGPAARQRVQPIDIPASPELSYRHDEYVLPNSPEKEKSYAGTSPLHAELESHFRNKLSSPPNTVITTPPTSPKLNKLLNTPPKSPVRTNRDHKMDEKTKIKLPPLSALQQRVLLLKDEPDSHRSLNIKPDTPPRIIKSHSFKSTKYDEVVTSSKSSKDEANLNRLKTITNQVRRTSSPNHSKINTSSHQVKVTSNQIKLSTEKHFNEDMNKSIMKSMSLDSITNPDTKFDTKESLSIEKESEIFEKESKSIEKEAKVVEKVSKSNMIQRIVESKKETRHESRVYPVVLNTEVAKTYPVVLKKSEMSEMNHVNESQKTEDKVTSSEEHKNETSIKDCKNEMFTTKSQMSNYKEQKFQINTDDQVFSSSSENQITTKDHKNEVSITKIDKFEENRINENDKLQHEFENFFTSKKQTHEDVENKTANSVTISGPSHTAIVSIGNVSSDLNRIQCTENLQKEVVRDDNHKEIKIKEQQISVTKIQLKRETIQNSTKKSNADFLNVHLNKVENKRSSNVILSTTPKIIDEQKKSKEINEQKHLREAQKLIEDQNNLNEIEQKSTKENGQIIAVEEKKILEENVNERNKPKEIDRPKNLQEQSPKLENKRKFSSDDIEIIENSENNVSTAFITISSSPQYNTPTTQSARIFKKHSESQSCPQQRKSSLVCESNNKDEKPILRAKSCSLEIPTDATTKKANDSLQTQKSLDDLDNNNKKKKIDKMDNVILRRKMINSKKEEEPELMKVFARLSLKLKDSECDEINQQLIMNVEESSNKSRDSDKENQSDSPAEERKKINSNIKEIGKNRDTTIENNDVQLRKPINNKINAFQRAVSLNMIKNNEIINNDKIQKQSSIIERPKTDGWTLKNNDTISSDRKTTAEDIMKNSTIVDNDYINEVAVKPKNVNQRKAEWEKRAQEAKMKTMP